LRSSSFLLTYLPTKSYGEAIGDMASRWCYCQTFLVHAGVDAFAQSTCAALVAVYLVDGARFRLSTWPTLVLSAAPHRPLISKPHTRHQQTIYIEATRDLKPLPRTALPRRQHSRF